MYTLLCYWSTLYISTCAQRMQYSRQVLSLRNKMGTWNCYRKDPGRGNSSVVCSVICTHAQTGSFRSIFTDVCIVCHQWLGTQTRQLQFTSGSPGITRCHTVHHQQDLAVLMVTGIFCQSLVNLFTYLEDLQSGSKFTKSTSVWSSLHTH